MGMMNGIVRETEREMGNIEGVALPSQLGIVFLWNIFLAGYSVSATPLLMSPISDF
jgi:hypothetical protein